MVQPINLINFYIILEDKELALSRKVINMMVKG